MKQLSLLLVAVIVVWGISSCDNAKLEAMKADQSQRVDSLANAQIAEVKAQLMEDCDASVEEVIRAKVDSIQASMVVGKSNSGSGKTSLTPTKKPTATTPAPKPKRDIKDRRNGEVSTPVGGGSNSGGTTITPGAKPNTGSSRDLKNRRRGN
ncbi:MAG: hypothetical protein AB8B69_01840 [Chitinophagales bacterium]